MTSSIRGSARKWSAACRSVTPEYLEDAYQEAALALWMLCQDKDALAACLETADKPAAFLAGYAVNVARDAVKTEAQRDSRHVSIFATGEDDPEPEDSCNPLFQAVSGLLTSGGGGKRHAGWTYQADQQIDVAIALERTAEEIRAGECRGQGREHRLAVLWRCSGWRRSMTSRCGAR